MPVSQEQRTLPRSARVLNLKVIAVDWVALVSCMQREAGGRASSLGLECQELIQYAFVYWGSWRWVEVVCTDGLSLTQVSKVLTSRTQLWETLFRRGWLMPGLHTYRSNMAETSFGIGVCHSLPLSPQALITFACWYSSLRPSDILGWLVWNDLRPKESDFRN